MRSMVAWSRKKCWPNRFLGWCLLFTIYAVGPFI